MFLRMIKKQKLLPPWDSNRNLSSSLNLKSCIRVTVLRIHSPDPPLREHTGNIQYKIHLICLRFSTTLHFTNRKHSTLAFPYMLPYAVLLLCKFQPLSQPTHKIRCHALKSQSSILEHISTGLHSCLPKLLIL